MDEESFGRIWCVSRRFRAPANGPPPMASRTVCTVHICTYQLLLTVYIIRSKGVCARRSWHAIKQTRWPKWSRWMDGDRLPRLELQWSGRFDEDINEVGYLTDQSLGPSPTLSLT